MEKRAKCCQVARLWLGVLLCLCGLSLASAAQLAAETPLPDARSALESSAIPVSQLWFPPPTGSQGPTNQQSANQNASDRSLVGLIKRGVRDQKKIYSAPFHRQNLKWDALFLVATGGLIAADKHITGAISHNNLAVSQDISDIGLYSTLATTGVLYLFRHRQKRRTRSGNRLFGSGSLRKHSGGGRRCAAHRWPGTSARRKR
jgi:hypothetical protein